MSLVWTLDPGAAAGRYEAAGGGAQPVTLTFTAAEIAARVDGGSQSSSIEWVSFPVDTPLLSLLVRANTLDNNWIANGLAGFTPGASSAAVWAGGEFWSLPTSPTGNVYLLDFGSALTGDLFMLAPAGAAVYAVFTGDVTPPSTGAITLQVAT